MAQRKEKLTARMAFALTPSLQRAFEARAKALHLDVPALARAALAVVAERGLDFGGQNGKEKDHGQATN